MEEIPDYEEAVAEVVVGLHELNLATGEAVWNLKVEKPKLFWALIGVVCWTIFVAAVPCVVFTASNPDAFRAPPSVEGLDVTLMASLLLGSVQALIVLALPPCVVLTFVLLASRGTSAEELADLAPEFPDFSPMPEEFADFERMLEEAKEKSGTLICFECGHHNPVGQSQCEDCGAWVPQTAKARWTYGKHE